MGDIIGKEAILQLAEKVYNGNIPHNIARIIPYLYRVYFTSTNSRYCHAYTVNTVVEDNYNDSEHGRFQRVCNEFEKAINEKRIQICKELERIGYDMQDEYFTETTLLEGIRETDPLFYDDGTLYRKNKSIA